MVFTTRNSAMFLSRGKSLGEYEGHSKMERNTGLGSFITITEDYLKKEATKKVKKRVFGSGLKKRELSWDHSKEPTRTERR